MKNLLVNLFLENKPKNFKERISVTLKAIKICLSETRRLESTGLSQRQAIRKVNQVWNEAGWLLIRKGYPFYKENGFIIYLQETKPPQSLVRTKSPQRLVRTKFSIN